MENQGYSITLRSKKVVLLREYKLKHREIAAQAIAGKSEGDQMVFAIMFQKEILRLLIHSVNGKIVTAKDLLDMDAYFTPGEYSDIEKVLKKVIGNDEEGEDGPFVPTVELVNIGGT